jgi:hypothetical protein
MTTIVNQKQTQSSIIATNTHNAKNQTAMQCPSCVSPVVCRLQSPSLFTAYDYYNRTLHAPVPPGARDPDCAHACKLLSPARAVEWIYVDGLRRRYGWNSTRADARAD